MEEIEVAQVLERSETDADLAEYLLTAMFSLNGRVLHAQYYPLCGAAEGADGDWHVCAGLQDHVLATTDNKGLFRNVLARFGYAYMGSQMYGGYAERILTQNGRRRHCLIYMGNDQQRGYWIRIYAHDHPH